MWSRLGPDNVSASDRAAWGKIAIWLDTVCDKLEGDETKHIIGRKWAFKMSHLVNSIMLGSKLRNTATLKQALEYALRIVLPEGWGKLFMDSFESTNSCPSSSTLQRHQLTLHVGSAGTIPTSQRQSGTETCINRPACFPFGQAPAPSRNNLEHVGAVCRIVRSIRLAATKVRSRSPQLHTCTQFPQARRSSC